MVSKQIDQRKTINIIAATVAAITVVVMIVFVVIILQENPETEPTTNDDSEDTLVEDDVEIDENYSDEPIDEIIDFQPVVDSWVNSVGGKKGIMIYDLNNGDVVGEYNAEEKFSTASLYKLFVVYEGYSRLQDGEWSRDDIVGATGRTVLNCLDMAIRVSHSPCAETLWSMIGRDELNTIVQTEFDLSDMWVTSLTATPSEITAMMKMFYEHIEIEDADLISKMEDSFLNQPATDYNWRQGLPSGFSEIAKVYNKVGWNYDASQRVWTIYDDAAIVEFTEAERDYIVVVMTSGVDYSQIKRFGSEIEGRFVEARQEIYARKVAEEEEEEEEPTEETTEESESAEEL